MPKTQARRATTLASLIAGLLFAATAVAQDQGAQQQGPTEQELQEQRKQKLLQVVQNDKDINVRSAQVQGQIDQLNDQTQALQGKYRTALQQIETLRVYNRQLDQLIRSQDLEMASMQRQIDSVVDVERGIRPLMEDMIDALEQFVALDVPFLAEERTARVVKLRELAGRADVSVGEVYRRIMEAWQIENDYGRAVDEYRGTIEVGGETKTVDFLKIGRVVFMYVTLDGSEAGVWNQEAQAWQPADEFSASVRQALKMARKQSAFDLVTLPVPAPQEVN